MAQQPPATDTAPTSKPGDHCAPTHALCKRWAWTWDLMQLLGAGVLYAIALRYFVLPAKVILTGTEGIAAALSYYFQSPALFIGLYLLFQIGMLGFGFRHVSRLFAIRSAMVVAVVVVLLATLPDLQFAQPESQNERILLVLFGGILAGVAKALAFRHRGSTGDEDILGAYFAMKYLRPVGSIAVIAATISTAFGLGMDLLGGGTFETAVNTLMYTGIYIFASAETLNNLYRKFQLTMVVVIANDHKRIAQALSERLPHRTHTVHAGTGGRSGAAFCTLQTIVTHEELPAVLDTLEATDPNAFYYHHDLEGASRRYHIPPIA